MAIKFYHYSAFHTSDAKAISLNFKSVEFRVTRKGVFDAWIERNTPAGGGGMITEQQLRYPLRGQPP